MEINRNQYFAVGIVVLLLGIQFRSIDSFTLNAQSSEMVRAKFSKNNKPELVANESSFSSYFQSSEPLATTNITVKPKKWIGWALLSTGGVLVLHSLAMSRPQ